MAVIKKNSMTEQVFDGISAVYAVQGGFTMSKTSEHTVDITGKDLVELPCSESSGVSINGGTPSTTVFRVHGLNAPWTSHITPGDAEVTLQVPTYDSSVLSLIYGSAYSSNDMVFPVPSGTLSDETIETLKGKSFAFPEKAVNLGLLIINDTEDKALFIKKVKLLASPEFAGEDVPFVVNLTGTVASGGDLDAMAILEPEANSETPSSNL